MARGRKGGNSMPGNELPVRPQEEQKHPDEWQRDLNPHYMAGQNIGRASTGSDARARTAADLKSLVEKLSQFTQDELSQVPIVPEGAQLKQGAVYLDLRDPAPVPLTATAGIVADPGHYYTPKAEVPYEIWNRLVEALGPARIRSDAPTDAPENKPFTPQRAEVETAIDEPRSSALRGKPDDHKVDEAIAASFPASDPPAWTTGREQGSRTPPAGADDLDALSDAELKRIAGELNINRRENMGREQLIAAVRAQLADTEA